VNLEVYNVSGSFSLFENPKKQEMLSNNVMESLKRKSLKAVFKTKNGKQPGQLVVPIADPKVTVQIFQTGRVLIHAAVTVQECERAASVVLQRICERQQMCSVKFVPGVFDFKMISVHAKCHVGFGIHLENASKDPAFRRCKFNPNLHDPSLCYNMKNQNAKLRVFVSGKMNICAKTLQEIEQAVNLIYPRLKRFKLENF